MHGDYARLYLKKVHHYIAQQDYMQQIHGEGDTRVDRDIDKEGEQATADNDDDEPEVEAVEI